MKLDCSVLNYHKIKKGGVREESVECNIDLAGFFLFQKRQGHQISFLNDLLKNCTNVKVKF